LSKSGAHEVRNKVEVALKQGMILIPDNSGTNIVQIFDTVKINWANSSFHQRILGIKTGINSNGLCLWRAGV
jgi:hypothetical protein